MSKVHWTYLVGLSYVKSLQFQACVNGVKIIHNGSFLTTVIIPNVFVDPIVRQQSMPSISASPPPSTGSTAWTVYRVRSLGIFLVVAGEEAVFFVFGSIVVAALAGGVLVVVVIGRICSPRKGTYFAVDLDVFLAVLRYRSGLKVRWWGRIRIVVLAWGRTLPVTSRALCRWRLFATRCVSWALCPLPLSFNFASNRIRIQARYKPVCGKNLGRNVGPERVSR